MFLDYCTLFNGILDFFLIKTLNFCIILDFCILLLLTDNMQKSRFNCIFKIIYGKYLWDNAKSFMVNIYGIVWENHLYLYLNDEFQKVFIFIFIYPKKNHLYPTLLFLFQNQPGDLPYVLLKSTLVILNSDRFIV